MPLSQVAEKIRALGMKFGIWIEPEMVCEDSDLYREHPDWAFTIPGRKPVRARYQLVLDYSRKEVVDGIFTQIAKVLDETRADYVKMDMNRHLTDVWSKTAGEQNQGAILHRYMLGVYDFLERLHERYPALLIEGCSGGGGRFDAGMLYYTPQIWCSDNTDAIERVKIQYGTSFAYPSCTVGSHVSAVPNHQTGRTTELATRAAAAMAGSFGYELDLNLLTEEEKEQVRAQIKNYHRFEMLIRQGRYYRLTDVWQKKEYAAWEYCRPAAKMGSGSTGHRMRWNRSTIQGHSLCMPECRFRGLGMSIRLGRCTLRKCKENIWKGGCRRCCEGKLSEAGACFVPMSENKKS